jgi:Zn-dependent metalloprotease
LRTYPGFELYLVDGSKPMFDAASNPPNNGRGVILIYDGANKQVTDPQFSAGLVKSDSVGSGWDPDAVGAAYGLSQTYDYYRERFGRDSLDGQKGNIRAMVRYGNNVQNAFWFGTTKTMVFGFGFTREIDITGHELTHGVIDNIGNGGILEYQFQSGAMNEALADLFGEMVEARNKNGRPDWLKADPFEPAPIGIKPEW